MTTYFIDTGFLIALELADDPHHAAAVAAWRDVRRRRSAFVTTADVLDEVVTFSTHAAITPKQCRSAKPSFRAGSRG